MSEILITYITNAGSTSEVARVIAGELQQKGNHVVVKPIAEVSDISAFDAVLVGAPMIIGWHNDAKKFIHKFQKNLAEKKCAYFCTLVSLTKDDTETVNNIPITIDSFCAKRPANQRKLTVHEKYSLPINYVKPILQQAPQVKPLSIGLFGGNLDMGKLNFFQMLFVMGIIRATPGDYRNWPEIKAWVQALNL